MDIAFIEQCAPTVSPRMIEQIIQVESSGNPLAVNINRFDGKFTLPKSKIEAVELAKRYISQGYSVDMGLMQINSKNLPRLNLTVKQVFNECTNIGAGATILSANYASAAKAYGEGQIALQAALSAYNTGNFADGFRNGYVSKYLKSAPAYLTSDTKVDFSIENKRRFGNDTTDAGTAIPFSRSRETDGSEYTW